MKLTRILAALSTFAALALLIVACSGSPAGPSAAVGAAVGGTTLDCTKPVPEICGNNIDDDCDGKVDEDCSTCKPVPEVCGDKIDNDCDGQVDENCGGTPCSPGYWTHAGYPEPFNSVCQAAAAADPNDRFNSCQDLLNALPGYCTGSETKCGRQAAANLLNAASPGGVCFE